MPPESLPPEADEDDDREQRHDYQQDERDLRRWAYNKHMVPIGDGCYRTTPTTKE